MKQTFYSNGKLLITGEYLVLDGASAFALPTKFGQNLIVDKGNNQEIKWTSFDADGSIWFNETITFGAIIKNENTTIESVKNTLTTILHEAYLLNPAFILNENGYVICTNLNFPKNWGLGTSSTLLNNIAQWLEIDAFSLLKNSFGGSGYDIACAQNNSPILFRLNNGKPRIEKIIFEPQFTENIYFVYLNKKQSSKTAIASYYKQKNNNLESTISEINKITEDFLESKSRNQFALAIQKHEKYMSAILELKTVKESLFPDFDGSVKSLGAWGGDFVMVISEKNPIPYFSSKGFETVLRYSEMIL